MNRMPTTILQFTGYTNIPKMVFTTSVIDYELWIDGKLLISNKDNNGTARRFSRSDKSVALAKGACMHSS